jgi:hypothetical protein
LTSGKWLSSLEESALRGIIHGMNERWCGS